MQVTLSRVVEAARQRKAAVTAEAGGYIVLLAVQRLAAQPRQIDSELIQLTATGDILIEGSDPAQAGDTEAALRRLLTTLVSLSHTAPPALRAAAERPATGSLSALESELTAALIPINHAASGRALARLCRETEKALRGSPGSAASPSAAPSSKPSSPSVSGSTELATPRPGAVAAAEPGYGGAAPPPSRVFLQSEADSLEIDVDVVASDDEEADATAPSSRAPAPSVSLAALATGAARTDAPQLFVEELDELDVHALDGEEPLGAAVVTSERGREAAADELCAEAHEVADELDVLLAELPPPLPAQVTAELRLDLSAVSGAVSNVDVPASPMPEAAMMRVAETAPPPQRSDLRELLNGFLAHTRCEEEMTANLRRMIGLEPWRPSSASMGPKMGPPGAPGRTP